MPKLKAKKTQKATEAWKKIRKQKRIKKNKNDERKYDILSRNAFSWKHREWQKCRPDLLWF